MRVIVRMIDVLCPVSVVRCVCQCLLRVLCPCDSCQLVCVQVRGMFVLLFVLCLMTAIAGAVWLEDKGNDAWYVHPAYITSQVSQSVSQQLRIRQAVSQLVSFAALSQSGCSTLSLTCSTTQVPGSKGLRRSSRLQS